MKNLLAIILLAIVAFGCGNKQTKMKEQQRVDSIAQIEKQIQDSIEQIRIDSLASIAWGDALFGMSIEEALNTNAFKGSDISEARDGGMMLSLPNEKRNIGNTYIDVMSFRVFFKMDELCHIFIKSYPQTANRISDLESDAISIAKKFEKKYGEPTIKLDKKINILDISSSEPVIIRQWNIGYDKTVFISLCEETSGYKYYYEVSIFGWKYPIKKDIQKAKQETKEQKRKKELEQFQF